MPKTLICNEINENGICPFSGNNCSSQCMAHVVVKEHENGKEVSKSICALSIHIEQQILIANHLQDIQEQLESQNSHPDKIMAGLCYTTGFMVALAIIKLVDTIIDKIF